MTSFSHYTRTVPSTYSEVGASTLALTSVVDDITSGVDDSAVAVPIPDDATGIRVVIELDAPSTDYARYQDSDLRPTSTKGIKIEDGGVIWLGDTPESKSDSLQMAKLEILVAGLGVKTGNAYITYYKRN